MKTLTLVTAAEAAELYGCIPETINYWRRTGRIRPVTGSGRKSDPWLYDLAQLNKVRGYTKIRRDRGSTRRRLNPRRLDNRILEVLDVVGYSTGPNLADRLNASPESVRKWLNDLRSRGVVDKYEAWWCLPGRYPPVGWQGPVGRLTV